MAKVEVTLTRNYFKQVTVEMEVPDEMVSGDDCSKVTLTHITVTVGMKDESGN